MLGFVDVRVSEGERAGEKVGEGTCEGIGDNDAEEGREREEADGLGIEEVRWW